MANEMYPLSRQAFADGLLNFTGTDWRCVLLNDTYVYDPLHDFHADLTGIVATSANLATKTNVLGVCDAADVTFAAVAAGPDVTQVVVYQWTGSSATSRLVIFYDTLASAVLIDTTPDGGDITVRWSNGATRIFRV